MPAGPRRLSPAAERSAPAPRGSRRTRPLSGTGPVRALPRCRESAAPTALLGPLHVLVCSVWPSPYRPAGQFFPTVAANRTTNLPEEAVAPGGRGLGACCLGRAGGL